MIGNRVISFNTFISLRIGLPTQFFSWFPEKNNLNRCVDEAMFTTHRINLVSTGNSEPSFMVFSKNVRMVTPLVHALDYDIPFKSVPFFLQYPVYFPKRLIQVVFVFL